MRKYFTLLFSLIVLASSGQSLTDSLQIFLKFGNNLNDNSGHNRVFNAYNGPVYTTDRFGHQNEAIKFDGQNDYLLLNNADFMATNSFSMAAWIRPDAWPGSGQNAMFVNLGNTTYDHGTTLANGYLGYSGFTVFSYNSGSGNASAYDPTFAVSLNHWYHIVLVRDGNTLKFYANGQLLDTDVASSNPAFTSITKLWLGCRIGNNMFANGAIDDFRAYNRSLSATEVNNLYQYSDEIVPPPFHVPNSACIEYKFQNNTLDSGGQGYNLTNHGGTYTQDRFGHPNSAIQFNGINQYLELSNADSIATTGEMTIGVWVKPYNLPGNGQQGDIVNMGDANYDHGLNLANGYLNTYNGFHESPLVYHEFRQNAYV
ncbi:MAG: hypothetical protein GC180_09015 [Bacteroidetes bacterium]|nr:hypothetical protein [Bacteroidota bacterium]